MKTAWLRYVAIFAVVAGSWLVGPAAQGQQVVDDFESYAVGTFPTANWLDVGTIDPDPGQLVPSAMVISTTDAFGNPTQALQTIDQIVSSKGIYHLVPVSSHYKLDADIRTDQFSDNATFPAADWSMQLTFAQVAVNFCCTPQAGIYASSATAGWRLFLISSGAVPLFADIDLGATASVGTWYHVHLDLDATNGTFHSEISDIAAATVLVDQIDVIPGWQPDNGQFDSVAFFGGDTNGGETVSSVGTVDNINVFAVPEPGAAALGIGMIAFLGGFRRCRRCP